MSEVLTIEGIQYVSATHAGNHFGYTKDYLSMLINAGKIEGHKVGRKWYVNFNSAEIFFKTAHEQRTAYRKHISAERKKELHHHTQVRTAHRPQNAILETLVILILGLSMGVTGYLGTTVHQASVTASNTSFLKNIAIALYTFITPTETVSVALSPHMQSPERTTQYASAGTLYSNSSTTSALIVLPPASATDTDTIAESFSDAVIVTPDPQHPNTGVVTPIFKNTKGEPYRFLLVPMGEERSAE